MTDGNSNGRGITRRALGRIGAAAALAASAPAIAAPAARKRSLAVADRLAIEDLFSNYVWSYDCTDPDEFIALFTADAQVVGRGKLYANREQILGWFRYLIDMREAEGDDIWMHEAGQFRFDPQADGSCVVYAYATHFNGLSTTTRRGVRSLGYFVSHCVREGGEWKFRRFSITTWDRKSVPWKKPLPWAA